MEGVDELDLNATIAQMFSKRRGKKNVKSEAKKKTGERGKNTAQSVVVDQESLLGYEEGQKDDAPPGITVSAFDYSAENYLNVVDKICKLCGQTKSDDLDENEIERLSSFVTFVREWRHFTYPPRAIRFSRQSVSSPQGKDVTGGIDLPQFSAATVPKNGLQNGNMLCQEPSNDFVMNVGGLVWALDWCPRVHQWSESSDCRVNCEFIAVAAHPPESSYHKVGAPLIGRGVIQIWCLLNIGVKEEEVPRTKNKATQNQSSSTGKATSPNESRTRGRPRKNRVNESADNLDENTEYVQPKKPRGRPKNKPVTESLDNLSGNNELYVQALSVQFPENASKLLPIDTIRENTSECVAKKVSGTPLKACRRGSVADNLMLESSVKRRRLKAMAREGNFVDPDHMPLLTENENGESSPANNALLSSVQDPLESSPASCVIPKDVALPRVVLCLAHNGKVAWDVKWRPSFVNDAESNHRMGYLAVLLGNGALEVWEVPLPQTIKAIYSTCQTEGTDPRFVKLEPVFRCSKLKSGDRQSIPLTVEWSASAPHDFILAGCHDGVVALWKFSANGRSEDTRPLLCFSADTVPIRGLAWAPVESDSESANVIVTAGHKGIKFWDIRDPFCPLWDLNPVQRNIYSMDWLPDPRCVIVSFDDGTLRILSLVKAAYDVPVTGKPFVGTQQQGFHSYYCSSFAIWSVQVSRLTGMVAYCSADGTVLCFQLTAREVEKDPRRNRAPHFLCGSLTEEESTLTINTPLPDTPFPMKKSLNEWSNAPRTIRGYLSKSNPDGAIKPQTVITTLSDLTAPRKADTIISTGVGQHQMWTAQHFRWRAPRSMITSGGLGTMGYGLPAAIGAKVAEPNKLVIDIDGDASFLMTQTELGTAAEFNIGVKVLVLNNEEQGMVTQWQSLFYSDRFAHTHQRNPNFVKLAEAMHVPARRTVKLATLKEDLEWLISGSGEGPAFLEVVVDQKVPVLPMVPAGSALHEFLVYDEAKEKERRQRTRERSGR